MIDCTCGGYVYVASMAIGDSALARPGSVFQYSLGADGSLVPLGVASVSAGVDPTGIVSHPQGHYVYVVNQGDNTISQYAVSAGGGLTALSPAVVSVPVSLSQGEDLWVSIDPSGRYLYVVASPPGPTLVAAPASIAQYSIGSGGLLTPLMQASLTLPNFASGALAFDLSGHHAYLATGGSVLQFSIGPTGTLSPLATASVAAANPSGITVASTQAAYVLSRCVDHLCDGQVALYMIGADGSLSATGLTTTAGSHINPVAMSITGDNAYLLTNFMGVDTNSGKLYPYTINSSGALVPGGEIDTGSGGVAEALYAGNLYVLTSDALAAIPNGSGGHVAHFTLGSGGMLTAAGTTPIAGTNPTALTVVKVQ
jgi:6-phosphogluconolactonase (cycloisomerase 2 family)